MGAYTPATHGTVKSVIDDMVTQEQLKRALAEYPVNVIRCEECLHHGGKNSEDECALLTELLQLKNIWIRTQPFDFCSSGERRTE